MRQREREKKQKSKLWFRFWIEHSYTHIYAQSFLLFRTHISFVYRSLFYSVCSASYCTQIHNWSVKRTPTQPYSKQCTQYAHTHRDTLLRLYIPYKHTHTFTYKHLHHTLLCILLICRVVVCFSEQEGIYRRCRCRTYIYNFFFHFNTISIFNLLISFHAIATTTKIYMQIHYITSNLNGGKSK